MLSVCIIAKNEEENIGRCLGALSGYGFELIVADTGSTDLTMEIAKRFTDKVYNFAWCDDFAAAKNYAISKAKNDLVMVVDSDEFLDPLSEADVRRLEVQMEQNRNAVGRIRIRNVLSREGTRQEKREWVSRIFDRRKFCYKGRIHEQVVSMQNKEFQTWLSPLTFLHTGYDLPFEERKRKTQRNITMLERELSEVVSEINALRQKGGGDSRLLELEEQVPYIQYQLGKSWYMAHDYERAYEYFAQGLSHDLNPKLEYVIDMVETYGYALLNDNQENAALSFENIYEEFGNSADFQFLMGLIYMRNARFDAAIREFEKASRQPESRNVGVNSYAANYNIGVIYECLGELKKAYVYYKKCGEYEPAKERLRKVNF